nr:uncharacterized protein LOC129051164 [Pongo abelii]
MTQEECTESQEKTHTLKLKQKVFSSAKVSSPVMAASHALACAPLPKGARAIQHKHPDRLTGRSEALRLALIQSEHDHKVQSEFLYFAVELLAARRRGLGIRSHLPYAGGWSRGSAARLAAVFRSNGEIAARLERIASVAWLPALCPSCPSVELPVVEGFKSKRLIDKDMDEARSHHPQQTDTGIENQTPHVLTHKWESNNENIWTQGMEQNTPAPVRDWGLEGRKLREWVNRYSKPPWHMYLTNLPILHMCPGT